jgi:hypothetical protein
LLQLPFDLIPRAFEFEFSHTQEIAFEETDGCVASANPDDRLGKIAP